MKHYVTLLVVLMAQLVAIGQASVSVSHLTCEYKTNPLGIEATQPRLSWIITSSVTNSKQTAYQILVADSKQNLQHNKGNIWDSKKLATAQSLQVLYKGLPLVAAKKYYWKLRVWNQQNIASNWSEIACWQMGLLNAKDWGEAKWITMDIFNEAKYPSLDSAVKLVALKTIAPQFRKEILVKKAVKNATAFVCGLGQFELRLNGNKVSDHFLDPGWTTYQKYSLYVPFDITNQLKQGSNVIGVMLGNGFYYLPKGRYIKGQIMQHGLPKMIAKIVVEYTDGTTETIVSNQSWKNSKSPITYNTIYGGEDYDATLEQNGWDKTAFNDSAWQPSVVVKGSPVLIEQQAEPLKVMETFKPIAIFKNAKGNWVYDLGQNASGIVNLVVQGQSGKQLKVFPAELIDADSAINQAATGKGYCFSYTLKGASVEQWQPRFSYYGFRYVQLQGAVPQGQANPLNLPVVKTLEALHTRYAAEKIGNFSCSNALFNKIYSLIDWAIKSNMASVLTDCPHREKLGWLEQVHLMMASNQYNYNFTGLNTKAVVDMQAAQYATGFVPTTAPEFGRFGGPLSMFSDSPEWGSAYVIMPWYMYKWYGDIQVLQQHYDGMKKYVAYLQKQANAHNIIAYGLGDWFDIGPKRPGVSQLTSLGVTGTAIWYYDVTILQQVAKLLHKNADATYYQTLGEAIKMGFNKKYFHANTYQYDNGSQTANAMALYMNLVEPENRDKVLANIFNNLQANNNAITAGDIGFRYLMQTLQQGNASQLIFNMNNRTDVPGYGYQIAQGATALTESWQALRNVSNNHLMLGHLMEWLYSGLAGIKQTDSSIAFKNIVIHPEVVGDINHVQASYLSPYGLIKSEWHKTDSTFHLQVAIPVNTTAVIDVYGNAITSIFVNEKAATTAQGLKFIGKVQGRLQYQIGSGNYSFTTTVSNK
ncbi:MAG: family 78 glycoside hydrolase catalytic domain [Flavobacterium sp.]|nr:family 78 glycoside hydrolase catalytic domain [Flavobacterium sp.]